MFRKKKYNDELLIKNFNEEPKITVSFSNGIEIKFPFDTTNEQYVKIIQSIIKNS